jgi:hypothetical protein
MTLEHLDTIISFVAILAGVSLLVTTLTQMVSALFGLRGTNLRWGLETLLQHADPALAGHAREIADQVLHHPLISDSTMSGFETQLVKRWKLASVIRKDELITVLRTLASQATPPADGQPPAPWLTALRQSLDQLDQESAARLMQAAPQIREALPDDAAKADQIIAQLTASAEGLSRNLDQWFDSMMDRVSQRFVTHTRIWTIAFSILVAFALHLDAFKLLTQLSSDSELRARLVASADVLAKKADEINIGWTNQPPATSAAAFNQLTNAANNFHSILADKLRFQIMPDPYPEPFYSYWTPNWLHFWGIVASAALLSLGAPFWFNMLKTLSNLRPQLAKKEQQETEAAKAN